MEYSVFLFAFVLCSAGLVTDITEGISIDNCNSESPLDIQENAENNITCRDFDADANVTWSIKRPNITVPFVIASCTPSNCLPNDQDTEDDSLPIAAIAGGAGAAVVVIIIVVVVVVVVAIRRRQRRKPVEPPKTPRENDSNWKNRSTPPTPAAAGGDYEDVDLTFISCPSTEDGYDGYSAIGLTRQQARAVPEGDDNYTVADDSRIGSGPNRNGPGPGSETVSEIYAVVDKSRKRNAPPRNGPVQGSAADDYSEAEPEGDPYSHL